MRHSELLNLLVGLEYGQGKVNKNRRENTQLRKNGEDISILAHLPKNQTMLPRNYHNYITYAYSGIVIQMRPFEDTISFCHNWCWRINVYIFVRLATVHGSVDYSTTLDLSNFKVFFSYWEKYVSYMLSLHLLRYLSLEIINKIF